MFGSRLTPTYTPVRSPSAGRDRVSSSASAATCSMSVCCGSISSSSFGGMRKRANGTVRDSIGDPDRDASPTTATAWWVRLRNLSRTDRSLDGWNPARTILLDQHVGVDPAEAEPVDRRPPRALRSHGSAPRRIRNGPPS